MDELKKYLQENRTQLDQDEPRPQVWDAIRAAAPTTGASPLSVAKPNAATPPAKAATRVVPFQKILSWSAAACVLALAGIGAWNLYTPSANQRLAQVVNSSPRPANPSPTKTNAPTEANKDENLAQNPTANKDESLAKTSPANPPAGNQSLSNGQAYAQAPNAKTQALTAKAVPGKKMPLSSATDYMAQLENGFSAMLTAQKNRVNTTPMYAESAAYFRDFKVELDNLEKDEKQLKKEIQQKGLRDDQLDALINIYQQKLTILKQLQLEMNKTNNRYKQQRGPIDTSRSYFISI